VSDTSTAGQIPRSVEQIQADISSGQQQLAQTVDAISDRIAPEALARDAKDTVVSWFVDSDGRVKGRSVAIVAAAITGLVVLRQVFHD